MPTVRTTLGTQESARRERFEPSGNLSATNVQKAIEELDSEKLALITATIRKPGSAASIAILSGDIEVGIDTRSTAVTATLPSAVAWAAANPNGLELVITDYYGNAAANNITPSPFAGDSFAYGSVTPVVTANFGSLKLRPDPALPGWVVRGVN